MRHWALASAPGRCGKCGEGFTADAVIQVIQIGSIRHRFIRCQTCADGEPPDSVELAHERRHGSGPDVMTKLDTLMGKLRVDVKARQAGGDQ
jgi:hypothetical protein